MRLKENIWLILFVLILGVPVSIDLFFDVKEKPLEGYYTLSHKTNLSVHNWLSGKYQYKFDKYFSEKYPGRRTSLRLHRELEYHCFNKLYPERLILGEDGQLFTRRSLLEINGSNYESKDQVSQIFNSINTIYQRCKKDNKEFLFIIAANKGCFYSEHIPDNISIPPDSLRIYPQFLDYLKSFEGDYIDFNQYFIEIKDKSNSPLFTRSGIHWSLMSQELFIDSLNSYLENIHKIELNRLIVDSSKSKFTPLKNSDKDIEIAANLFSKLNDDSCKYHKLSFSKNHGKLKAMVIGDSFFWNAYHLGYNTSVLDSAKFFYYNKEIYSQGNKIVLSNQERLLHEYNNSDQIILIVNPANLAGFPWKVDEFLR